MPDQEIAFLNQKVRLWAMTGYDPYGQPTVSQSSVDIICAWGEDESQQLDPHGNTIRIDATAIVAQHIEVGSRMQLLEPPPSIGGVWNPTGAMHEVKSYKAVWDIKGRAVFREVSLIRLAAPATPTP